MKSIFFLALLSIFIYFGCSDQTTNVDPVDQNGRLKIHLIDSPAQLDSVIICVTRVEVHRAGSDSTSGWFVINDSTRFFDLLQLTNGASVILGDTSLPAGQYTQIRLFIGDGSYVIDQGTKHDLEVPSGSQSGLKLIHQFTIETGKLYELLLDFNVEKSIVITGNGKYKLKPTIRVTPIVISGSISGQVLPLYAQPTIRTVYGTDTVTTYTDLQGFFKLMGLPQGIYDVNIIPADKLIYRDTTITNIQVMANQDTDIGEITLETN
ncbi:MAG: DUF4382 domain-containing protein [Ignavibacteriaceae bacterium]|nr:DUF4382 domain-containing protein [Ignavibacteriaceae bacterium]